MTSITDRRYCNSLVEYSRFQTREVEIGDLRLGGDNPIRVQSMTTTDTMDVEATVAQSIRMIERGCELVRITAPSKADAENLSAIKKKLREKGYTAPLVADIHFTPNAAETAARIVEKVRINPGNYADKKKFELLDYSDAEYERELERIRKKFLPLVHICKEYGTAMRVGTNHGSLSDRIMSRYGDTPLGMVISALEFIDICEECDYHNIVISMKASNPQIMVQAYRVLTAEMIRRNMNYPLHLGVTEAGDGEDGRIKSAIGIGALLEDGLGDTVRVSLTEEPEEEIPVAQRLVAPYNNRRKTQRPIPPVEVYPIHPFEYSRRKTNTVENIGGHNPPRVLVDFRTMDIASPANLFRVGYNYSVPLDKWNIADMACDYIISNATEIPFEIPGTLGIVQPANVWNNNKERYYPMWNIAEYLSAESHHKKMNFIAAELQEITPTFIKKLLEDNTIVLIVSTNNSHAMAELRRIFVELMLNGVECPVVIGHNSLQTTSEEQLLDASVNIGSLFLEGLGDGILSTGTMSGNQKFYNETAFGILQATRTRISKTEYISCPSCGRTLFDLQETTAKIRSRTSHLKGVKIGIMGCIVNGPGEMADADYGYVGSGVGKITLYKGKDIVKKNIASENAVDELIEIIKSGGDWVDVATSQ